MNERIREFARTSHLDVYGLGKDRAKWEDTLEKFAESIVQECMNVLDPGEHQLIARFQARKWLAEHFGMNPKEITTAMLDATITQCEQELEKKKSGVEE